MNGGCGRNAQAGSVWVGQSTAVYPINRMTENTKIGFDHPASQRQWMPDDNRIVIVLKKQHQ